MTILDTLKTLWQGDAQAFAFHGGVHPQEHKHESTTLPIGSIPLSETFVLPLRQHVGNLPQLHVKVGDHVLKGEQLALPDGAVSAAIHAPTSGVISAIAPALIPHPSGLSDMCITLTADGQDTWCERISADWQNTPPATLLARLRDSGIVGLGGAAFPSQVKLLVRHAAVHTLVINAAECEPYITCDDMLMREHADAIVQGILIAQSLLGAKRVAIGIEDNKPHAIQAMQQAIAGFPNMTLSVVPTLYPSGDGRRLVHLLLGVEIPSHKRATEVGIQVFNVATVLAMFRYLVHGEPALSRIVTMTGNVARPQNFEVLFGTPLLNVINAAGGALPHTTHFVMGGPMMGFTLPSIQLSVTKAMNCVIAMNPDLFPAKPEAMACIRCARCADACPVNLQPQELYWFAKGGQFEKARDYQLFDCIECGCCDYVCPSRIPLVSYYRYAKSEIIASDTKQSAADMARQRNEARLARLEREKQERAQKHAQRAQAHKNQTTTEPATIPTQEDASIH